MTRPTGDFVDQLTAAAAEAKAVLGELRSELREVRQQRKALAEERAQVESMVRRAVEDEIRAATATAMKEMGDELQELSHKLYDRLSREATRIMNLSFYGNEQGRGPNILDEIRARLDAVELVPRTHHRAGTTPG